MHGEHYDADETRAPEERERQLLERLASTLAHARSACPHYARTLDGIAVERIDALADLASVPVTRKSDLQQLQTRSPPFGGIASKPLARFRRVFASPGPIYEPERLGADPWRMARALHAAGIRAGELVHNTFSYHFTPAGAMVESAAHALGCPVFAAGVGQTDQQVEAIAALRPGAYVGTPSFLKIILDRAEELARDVSSLTRALVSGEALPATLREALGARGVRALQCYATADLGLVAYESSERSGLIVDEGVILEIVTPGTGVPVADGTVGEVVVTTLDEDYPLIRFATGDLSAIAAGPSPCGRTNRRIKGWLGRADQTTKVRGMFVHPSMVAAVLARHPDIGRARLVVSSVEHQDQLRLECELDAPLDAQAADAIAASVREVTKLRAEVRALAAGELPNDGRVIVDERSYD